MAITIVLDTIKAHEWTVDVDQQVVRVVYTRRDSTGEDYGGDTAYFWVTIPELIDPETGEPLPTPDNWYQLPVEYQQTLLDLTQDAEAAIGQREGITT